jgi:hypothetical protein
MEKALGCLLGGAVDDAFGHCEEFDRLPAIEARFAPQGVKEPVFKNGKLIVSHDTQMTLLTLNRILKARQIFLLPRIRSGVFPGRAQTDSVASNHSAKGFAELFGTFPKKVVEALVIQSLSR